MNRRPIRSRRPAPRTLSEEGRGAARTQLLEAAGHVFAEKGFDRATGKEICELAGTNAAAINYYYGGMEKLYAEVLTEARRRIFAAAPLPVVTGAKPDPKALLTMFIEGIVRAMTAPASASWVMRVVSREVIAPTPGLEGQKERDMLPRAGLLRSIVAELMGMPEEHPCVARTCVNIMAPMCMLLICDRRSLKRVMPTLGLSSEDAPALAQHMVQYALAGMTAVAREAHRTS